MERFLPYTTQQAYLLPPSVQDELGGDHLCFFIHEMVEHLDLRSFEQAYSEQGGALYCPALMLKVWLYGYAVGMTSARRLEQRICEDLALRFLAGGAKPDNWALSAFRRRHARGLNDVFTQVLEAARELGLARLGQVAIDSTRVQASASKQRIDSAERLRRERTQLRRGVRRWQKACDAEDPNEGAGTRLRLERVREQLAELPRRLERLQKSGRAKLSRTDEGARFLHTREGFTLGYTADIAVNQDHLIVAQRVTQNATDHASLVPLADAAVGHDESKSEAAHPSKLGSKLGSKRGTVLADAGFFSVHNIVEMEARGWDVYLPDSNLARELNTGQLCRNGPHVGPLSATQQRMRQKLRAPEGRRMYARRKALVEPVFGSLKEQRGMKRFRLRGLEKVSIEWTLAAIGYNLTRLRALG